MKRILQILPGLSRGGLETFVINLYRAIDKKKVQFDFLVNCKDGDYKEEILRMGGNIYYIPPKKIHILQYNRNLDSFFKEHGNDYAAVHMHDSVLSAIEPLKYAKKYGIKIRILHAHSSSVSGNKIHYLLHYLKKANVHSWATHYFGCSDKANEWFYKYTGVLNKSVFIANGIDTSLYVYNKDIRNSIRSELCIPEKSIVIGHVGRIMWIKNHSFLVDIFNQYVKINPNSYLMLVGNGPLVQEIKNKISMYGLQNKVIFTGVRKDVNRLLQAFDIFVMPSIYEGLPVVLVEAQASGLPVLCSKTISQDSKITDNYYTLSIEQNEEIWAKKIEEVLSSFSRKNEQQQIIDAGFDINSTANYLQKIYLSCC